MSIFSKKPRKTPAEIQAEREAKIKDTSKSIRLQIATLEQKRETILKKVVEARQKGLKEPEIQARNMLRQIMASIKRENSMLMTLELAVEARDLAQLNANFLESIGTLSDEILGSGTKVSEAQTKKVGDKFLRAIYESNQQKERIDSMLEIGEYGSVLAQDSDSYSEFDDEIDYLVENAEANTAAPQGNYNRARY